MKNDKNRREIIAKAHNVTSAIKKKLSQKGEKPKIDLTNLAESLADRRDMVLSEESK